MNTRISLSCYILTTILLFTPIVYAKNSKSALTSDKVHANTWNQFAQRVYILHQHLISTHNTYTKESRGGYYGKDFYRQIKYYDKKTDQLLSRVAWELENPGTLHEIEVFIYDSNGKLKRDYLAAYLPEYRNAPIQTLINLHYQNDELKSFRQFDASGEKIYERCEGTFFGEPVSISLDDSDFAMYTPETARLLESEKYLSCFGNTLPTLSEYSDPLYGISLSPALARKVETNDAANPDAINKQLARLNRIIKQDKKPADLYRQRGDIYLKLRNFDKAVEDFTQAIKLDKSLDSAYFGRGLAYGRLKVFDKSFEDLTVYIKRNPNDSHAYTKRGVRYIWAEQYELAEKDLRKAIALNPDNAEAHDDLGVMEARKGNYKAAKEHFSKVVKLDPSYSKGFHNLAMSHFILGNYTESLSNINKSLELDPGNRNALLLKGETMLKLGRKKEAEAILDRAEFLPEGGWQERFSLQ